MHHTTRAAHPQAFRLRRHILSGTPQSRRDPTKAKRRSLRLTLGDARLGRMTNQKTVYQVSGGLFLASTGRGEKKKREEEGELDKMA